MALIPDRRGLLVMVLSLATGCGQREFGPQRKGPAAEVAQRYCTLLLLGDWSGARALTHPQHPISANSFEQKAKALVKRWNLEGAVAHVSSVGAKGNGSVVHLSLVGKRRGKTTRVTVSVLLKPDGESWKVLPPG